MAIETHYKTIRIDTVLIPERIHTKTERRYLNNFLFSEYGIVRTMVNGAVRDETILDDYIVKCAYAENLGTIMDHAIAPVLKEGDRGELFAEDIDLEVVEKASGIDPNMARNLISSLVRAQLLRSKLQRPRQWGSSKK